MRLPWLATIAALAVEVVLGSPAISISTEPIKRNVFADQDLPHVWAADSIKKIRARAVLATSSPKSLHARNEQLTARLSNVTESELHKAREIVEKAIEEAAVRNRRRYDNPLKNNYHLKDGTKIYGRDEAPALLSITDEIAEAAALVAEADVLSDDVELTNGSTVSQHETRQSKGFWMEDVKHQGAWPWGKNPSDFKVFRNVKDYGAKGDGKTDDTKAIRKAIEESGMCGDGCYSSTTHGAIIYFPAGTYLVSSTIEKYYGTQLIGNPNDRPVMKASKFFVGLGIFSTNKYYGDDTQDEATQDHAWFINTGIFWGQIRNFVIDISGAYKKVMMSGLHYQVSQATSLQYVEFKASTESDAEQRSIFAENGSGGHMSDLTFTGGKFGIFGGNQQFTGQRITFTNVRTAVQLVWDWGWTWKSIVVDGAETAFKLVSEDKSHGIGGALIVDSVIKNTKVAVAMFSPTQELGKGTTGLTLDNVKLDNVEILIDEMADDGKNSVRSTKVDGGKKDIGLWVLGRSYQDNAVGKDMIQESASSRALNMGDPANPLGLAKDPYFERAKPQYESISAADFVSTKNLGCKGDGQSDDRACLQGVIDDAAKNNKIIFIDAGTYILMDTLHIPSGTRIVGENWAQLAASGNMFGDEKNPRPVIQVGLPGEKGTVEMQDLIITSKGETPGAVFIEWNIEAEGPGKAAMWEVHIRVGGTDGSGLTSTKCPPDRAGVPPGCKGGSMMMHLTQSGSAYIENAWYWVADHDLDDPTWTDNNNKMTQTSVYVARGFLVESTKPTWLYGTSSEHSVFYQYEFFKSANVLAGMIQSEQPYYQPTPPAPAPFESSLGVFRGDPLFKCTKEDPCDSGWGLRVVDSRDITILGAGLYSWFSTYVQECLKTIDCQKTMAEVTGNKGDIVIHNLVTIGAVNMLRSDKDLISAKDNQAVDFHPRWSQLSRFEAREFKEPVTAEPSGGPGSGTDPLEAAQAQLLDVCTKSTQCEQPLLMKCGTGQTLVGYELASNCGLTGMGYSICCKTESAPTSCTWRGKPGGIKTDCAARCDDGEVAMYHNKAGGGPANDNDEYCTRGDKAFCCKHRAWSALTAGCVWEKQLTCTRTDTCSEGKTFLARRVTGGAGLGCQPPSENYCCPSDRVQLKDCAWQGGGDCANVACGDRQITLASGSYGDSLSVCNWQRKRSLCCSPSLTAPEATCPARVCEAEPWNCWKDPWALSDEDGATEESGGDVRRAAAAAAAAADGDDDYVDVDDDTSRDTQLEVRTNDKDPGSLKGGSRRDFMVLIAAQIIFLYARTYIGPSGSYGRNGGPRAGTNPTGFRTGGSGRGGCSALESFTISTELTSKPRTSPDTRYTGYEMDHRIDLQYLRDLVHAILHGDVASGRDVSQLIDPIDYATFEPYWNWNNNLLPLGLRQQAPAVPATSRRKTDSMANINNRLFEILGGTFNPGTLILLEGELNRVKGAIFNGVFDSTTGKRTGNVDPREDSKMRDSMNALIAPGGTMATQTAFFRDLQAVVAVWRAIRHSEIYPGIQTMRIALRNEITMIENETRQQSVRPNLAGFTAIFDEFDWDWWERAASHSREWILRWYTEALEALRLYTAAHGESHPEALWIERMLNDIYQACLSWCLRPNDDTSKITK